VSDLAARAPRAPDHRHNDRSSTHDRDKYMNVVALREDSERDSNTQHVHRMRIRESLDRFIIAYSRVLNEGVETESWWRNIYIWSRETATT